MELDIHLGGEWQACGSIRLRDPARASAADAVSFRYDPDYALEHLGACDFRALSVRAPVDLAVRHTASWPTFLCDVLPQGAAHTRLTRAAAGPFSDWALLQRGAANPVGNWRVRPAAARPSGSHRGFRLEDMMAGGPGFLEEAAEAGAAVTGAGDVAGESPKYWVVETQDGLWLPDDGRLGPVAQRHALLKFPDPAAGARAVGLLRLEVAYMTVAQSLGLAVPAVPTMVEDALWIPRFDRRSESGREIRLGVETLNSLAGIRDGSAPLMHHQALAALKRVSTDFDADLREYLRRDILNLAMGNRDNGGRNAAVLKDTDGSIRLAPLFDFGASWLDPRGISRGMRWAEEGRDAMDWGVLLLALQERFSEAELDLGDIDKIADDLVEFGHKLRDLPVLMRSCGIPDKIVEQRRPAISLMTRALAELEPA